MENKGFGLLPLLVIVSVLVCSWADHKSPTAYKLINKHITDCELEALSVGTRLADRYNMYDEGAEWDTRIHNDYVVQHLGFAGWLQMGTYKNTRLTAEKQDAPEIHRVKLMCLHTFGMDCIDC